MSKTQLLGLIIISIVIIGTGIMIFSGDEVTEPTETDIDKVSTPTEVQEYFNEQLQAGVLERVGRPIEGFLPFMFMQAFSGLVPQDFDGVEAEQGVYQLIEKELIFTVREDEQLHSAMDAVTKEGMATLLSNIQRRAKTSITSTEEIDGLLLFLGAPIKDIPTSADNAPEGSIHNLPVPDAVSAVRALVANELGISEGVVIVMTAYEKTWTNGCLDLAEEGEACTEALVPGYEVSVQAQGVLRTFHTNESGSSIRENVSGPCPGPDCTLDENIPY